MHSGGEHAFKGVDGELLMVIFIMSLLIVILIVISVAHYFIEKPKKRRMLHALRSYIHRKAHSKNNNTNSANASNVGSHASLNKTKDSGPVITVTDYSQFNSQDRIDEAKETDSLLENNNNTNGVQGQVSQGSILKSDVPSAFVPVFNDTRKVMFHIGETILEEGSPSSSQAKLQEEANNKNSSSSGMENDVINEENPECIKTISHLLDDKPWSSSQAHMDTYRRQSRSGSVFNNTNNQTNHVSFDLSNE